MERGLFRYDVTACETKVLYIFPFQSLIHISLFRNGLVLNFAIFFTDGYSFITNR